MLEVGQAAPDFTLEAHTGESVSLKDLRGKKVVLFFYPKDNTPGCTKESCAFRDLYDDFAQVDTAVYGISRDSIKSHNNFAAKYNLSMPLLSDASEEVCNAYGVLKEKNMYGKKVFGIERTSFVIDRDGNIAKIYPKVKVDGHAESVLDYVKTLD
ncbi:thioredoxin-dependent thiol peroxidase [Alicyclobacillus sp. SO9]|uniref:thioredoxin-dependent thiol peroxidase n=1 Tax=Alicyclobacillus sp. SO9 TaxID=2665646 RepID=UPI0018E7823E|nr:thioredoxin-dependent thiol peroxidase [Alicyclobacillus sp. SO9]QQE80375.1 thioredoxin-dependent thiol peroxidase [Alicyclobacillus sp. SO9]